MRILTEICNEVYNTGTIPDDMKHSIFVKIPKKANALDCTDYRTLCLMSNITKIILRVITARNIRKRIRKDAVRFQTRNGNERGNI